MNDRVEGSTPETIENLDQLDHGAAYRPIAPLSCVPPILQKWDVKGQTTQICEQGYDQKLPSALSFVALTGTV